MQHRHLNHDDLTLAAIDSIIERGRWRDWLRLARAIRQNAAIAHKVATLTSRRLSNTRDDFLDRKTFARWNRIAAGRTTE